MRCLVLSCSALRPHEISFSGLPGPLFPVDAQHFLAQPCLYLVASLLHYYPFASIHNKCDCICIIDTNTQRTGSRTARMGRRLAFATMCRGLPWLSTVQTSGVKINLVIKMAQYGSRLGPSLSNEIPYWPDVPQVCLAIARNPRQLLVKSLKKRRWQPQHWVALMNRRGSAGRPLSTVWRVRCSHASTGNSRPLAFRNLKQPQQVQLCSRSWHPPLPAQSPAVPARNMQNCGSLRIFCGRYERVFTVNLNACWCPATTLISFLRQL